MKKTLIDRLGILGVISFLSYTAAVVFAPLAYPGYDWKSQAVSDLSAANAPSLLMWNQLSALYGLCGIVCLMMVCVAIQGKLNLTIRTGIYVFTLMNWLSYAGFTMFPLSESGRGGTGFQDIMHISVTSAVIALSIVSLVMIMLGGYRKKRFISLAVYATIALALMVIGAVGVQAAPPEYFGIFQRFSNVIAANGFMMVLGLYLFSGKFSEQAAI